MYERMRLFSNWLEALLYIDQFITKLPKGKWISDIYQSIADDIFQAHPGLKTVDLLEICYWKKNRKKGVRVELIFELDYGPKKSKELEMVAYSYPGNNPNIPQCWNFEKRLSPFHPYASVQPFNLWVKKASSFYREPKSD